MPRKTRKSIKNNKKTLKKKGAGSRCIKCSKFPEPQWIKLPKGSSLYMTQPIECSKLTPSFCEDTGKTGVYLSSKQYIPLGMILEYNKPMYLCEYKMLEDQTLIIGKYEYRLLDPKRYFINNDTDELFPRNVSVLTKHNVSHYDDKSLPLENTDDNADIHPLFLTEGVYFGAEVFFSETKNLELVNSDFISVKKAEQIIEEYISSESNT